jgi:hypothetical protein
MLLFMRRLHSMEANQLLDGALSGALGEGEPVLHQLLCSVTALPWVCRGP